MSVFQVEEDGTLSSLDDLFFNDEWTTPAYTNTTGDVVTNCSNPT